MYQVTNQAVADAIESESRCFRAVLDFGEGVEIRDEDVGHIKPSLGSVQNGTPCIGNVVSTQCEIEILRIPDEIDKLEGKEFQLYFYLVDLISEFDDVENTLNTFRDYTMSELSEYTLEQLATTYFPVIPYEPIPIAKLTVLKCKKQSDYYVLTCSDRLYFADKEYKARIPFPASSEDVMSDIAEQIGCTAEIEPPESYLISSDGKILITTEEKILITSSYQFYISEIPDGCTMRQMIGYIAAMRGKFAVIDRTGTLVQRWYHEGDDWYLSGENDRYIDDFEISETPIYLKKLVCKVSDNQTLTTGGTGRKMEFECPYMDGTRLSELYQDICNDGYDKLINEYFPCDFTQKLGDPRFDLWDRIWLASEEVSDSDKPILLLNMNYTFDGGLTLSVSSGGDSDTESDANGTY